MDIGSLLLFTGGLLILHAFFIVATVCVSRSKQSRVRELALEDVTGAGLARLILSSAGRHHLSMQIGAFITALLAGVCSFALAHTAGRYISGDWGTLAVQIFVIMTVSFFALFFSQIGKGLSLAEPERMLCRIGAFVMFLSRILTPFVTLLSRIVGCFLSVFGVEAPLERELAVSAEDISELVEMSSKAGELEEDKREMIQGVFASSDTLVREVMTPRSEIIHISYEANLAEVAAVFGKEGISRVLVSGDDLDEVKGVVLVKDLVSFLGRAAPDFSLLKIMRSAYFVPSTKKVDDLLDEFRRAAVHFAVVLDEDGSVAGIVTLEDIIEEIVGDIFDEHDLPSREVQIRRTKSGDLMVAGSLIIEDLNARTDLNIPPGEYDTMAGFVIDVAGRIPNVGEFVEFKGIRIRVEAVSQNRITILRIVSPRKVSSSSVSSPETFETLPLLSDSNRDKIEEPVKKVSAM